MVSKQYLLMLATRDRAPPLFHIESSQCNIIFYHHNPTLSLL